MKDMRVEVQLLTCPFLSDKLPKFTMFPAMKTFPSTLLLHTPQLPASQIASLYTTDYHLAVLTMNHISSVHSSSHTSTSLPLNSMGFTKPPCKSTYTICDNFEVQDFQTVALDNNHWITDPVPDRHLCIHEHSQTHSLCCYPCPYMDLPQHCTSTHWISVTFQTLRMW